MLTPDDRVTLAELAGRALPGGNDRSLDPCAWTVTFAPAPLRNGFGQPPDKAPASVTYHGEAIHIDHHWFQTRIRMAWGEISVYRETDRAFPLEVSLRVAMCCRLPFSGALPVHASGVSLDGNGIVFFGVSGAGKSTIAATSPHPVLSDELVVVAAIQDGFEVSSSGFWWNLERRYAPQGYVPLRALVALDKGPAFAIERLSPRDGFLSLSRALTLPASGALWSRALPVLNRLVATVPVYRMAWRLGTPPWSELEELLRDAYRERGGRGAAALSSGCKVAHPSPIASNAPQ